MALAEFALLYALARTTTCEQCRIEDHRMRAAPPKVTPEVALPTKTRENITRGPIEAVSVARAPSFEGTNDHVEVQHTGKKGREVGTPTAQRPGFQIP